MTAIHAPVEAPRARFAGLQPLRTASYALGIAGMILILSQLI